MIRTRDLTDDMLRRMGLRPTKAPARAARSDLGGYRNKWEREYARHLGLLQQAGRIAWWAYESVKLRLADGAWYMPDFCVLTPDGFVEFHEIKGYAREAWKVRHKVAVDRFGTAFAFRVISKRAGRWIEVAP